MLHASILCCGTRSYTFPCMLQNDGGQRKPLHKQKPAVWQQISANIFTHREKKTQHEDEIMICACPKPANGKPGCGPNCLNRQLAIECHPVSSSTYLLAGVWLSPLAGCLQSTSVSANEDCHAPFVHEKHATLQLYACILLQLYVVLRYA